MSKRLVSTVLGLAVIVAAQLVGSPAADAAARCGAYVTVHSTHYSGSASYCPMWRGSVPVFGKDSQGYVTPSKVVGHLNEGGSANWFICHWTAGRKYSAYGYSSSDYASTVADNGAKGWVSAVYFAGTQSYWYGLTECEDGYYGWG